MTVARAAPRSLAINMSLPLFSPGRMIGMIQSEQGKSEQDGYHIVRWQLQSTPNLGNNIPDTDDTFPFNKIRYQSDRVGDVSPPIYFWGQGGCGQDKNLTFKWVSYYASATHTELPVLDSHEELLTGAGNMTGGVYYGAGYTAVRFKASVKRYCLNASDLPHLGCRPNRGDLMSTTTPVTHSPYNSSLRPEDMPLQAESEHYLCCGPCSAGWNASEPDLWCTGDYRINRMTHVRLQESSSSGASGLELYVRGLYVPRCFSQGALLNATVFSDGVNTIHFSNVPARLTMTHPKVGRMKTWELGGPGLIGPFILNASEVMALNLTQVEDLQFVMNVYNMDLSHSFVLSVNEDPMWRRADFRTSWEMGPMTVNTTSTSLTPPNVTFVGTDADILRTVPEIIPHVSHGRLLCRCCGICCVSCDD
jgi:hypothetical protein